MSENLNPPTEPSFMVVAKDCISDLGWWKWVSLTICWLLSASIFLYVIYEAQPADKSDFEKVLICPGLQDYLAKLTTPISRKDLGEFCTKIRRDQYDKVILDDQRKSVLAK
jgi:hypothetical protein